VANWLPFFDPARDSFSQIWIQSDLPQQFFRPFLPPGDLGVLFVWFFNEIRGSELF